MVEVLLRCSARSPRHDGWCGAQVTFSRSGRSSAPFRATCPACHSLLELAAGHLVVLSQGLATVGADQISDSWAR